MAITTAVRYAIYQYKHIAVAIYLCECIWCTHHSAKISSAYKVIEYWYALPIKLVKASWPVRSMLTSFRCAQPPLKDSVCCMLTPPCCCCSHGSFRSLHIELCVCAQVAVVVAVVVVVAISVRNRCCNAVA
jgi:hypothetical protein